MNREEEQLQPRTSICSLRGMMGFAACILASVNVNLTWPRVIWKGGISIEKTLPLDLPVGKTMVHLLNS